MIEIIPAILAENYKDLQEKIGRYANYAKIVQIDICDGHFVSSRSWPLDKIPTNKIDAHLDKIIDEEEGLPYWDILDFEFDLMVANAIDKFDFFIRLGAKRIIFHLEAEPDQKKLIEFLEGLDNYFKENIEIGLAVSNNSTLDRIDPFVNLIDFIQIMGITNIGHQGEHFAENTINIITEIRSKYKDLIISVDGGINEINAKRLVDAGVNRLVIGSYLSNSSDLRATLESLKNL